jgi:hypothetical protein
MDKRLWLAVLLSGCALSAQAQDRCAFEAPRNLDAAAAGVKTLVVEARAGSLSIRGEPGLAQVRARGTACADRRDDLAQIRLLQRREGERLVITVEIPDTKEWNNGQRRLDLDLRVPSRLALEVRDSSGEAEIERVSSLRMQDSSGELRIADIPGAVRVNDSSGGIDVRNVGSLRIPVDSSGEIRVAGVRGDAIVDVDSSGGIEMRRIGGSARIGLDSSGSIFVEDVGGDFVVGRDGSGDVEHQRVRGKVSVAGR